MLLVHAFNQSTQEAVADSSVNLTIAKKGPRTALAVIQRLHDLKNKIKNKKKKIEETTVLKMFGAHKTIQ